MLNKCIYLPSGGINAMLYVLMYTERQCTNHHARKMKIEKQKIKPKKVFPQTLKALPYVLIGLSMVVL